MPVAHPILSGGKSIWRLDSVMEPHQAGERYSLSNWQEVHALKYLQGEGKLSKAYGPAPPYVALFCSKDFSSPALVGKADIPGYPRERESLPWTPGNKFRSRKTAGFRPDERLRLTRDGPDATFFHARRVSKKRVVRTAWNRGCVPVPVICQGHFVSTPLVRRRLFSCASPENA